MLTPDLLQRFTTHLKDALQKALQFGITHGRPVIEPGDLFVGLIQESGSIAAEILMKGGMTEAQARLAFRGQPIGAPDRIATPDLSPVVKRIIEKCVLTAHEHEHKYIGTEHLLFALIEGGYPEIIGFFEACGVRPEDVREQTLHVLRSTSRFPELHSAEEFLTDPRVHQEATRGPVSGAAPKSASRLSALETFTNELTKNEAAQQLDPVIGREIELMRVIEILCRRNKNNPILLGEPGVGKTAIVEGLAKKIAAGDVPDVLHGMRVLSLDLSLIVAGTMYRGEFEARLKTILEEVKEQPNVILFIDEIHNIVGAGSTSGSLDAANILKPALARGEIRCIGATTWNEYKKYIEPDAALERRFQPVSVDEPTAEQTKTILAGLLDAYAKFHRITFAPEIVDTCVHFAETYLTDRHFPDKAIDLLDESAASVNARRTSRETMERLAAFEAAVHAADEAVDRAIKEQNLDLAKHVKDDVLLLRTEYELFKKAMDDKRQQESPLVTHADVAAVVSRISGVSLEMILATERQRLSGLRERFSQVILGQPAAIDALADVVLKARLGLHDPKRPKAGLLFVGPPGTGKTETARLLAKEIFGRDDALIKLDMSEFAEHHTVSKLIGSPAGYVGYREGTRLTDQLRKRPHCVVLFDEFEKAHVDVQHLLLQILEDGQLTDSTGRSITFRHAYVILTSNIGSERLGAKPLGFGDNTTSFPSLVQEELKQTMKPELLNRLDRTVIFEPLGSEVLREIVRRELAEVVKRVEQAQRVACSASDDVVEWLQSKLPAPDQGAREARRIVEREVTSLITKLLTEKPAKKKIQLNITAGKMRAL